MEYVAGPIFIPQDAQHPLTGEKAPIKPNNIVMKERNLTGIIGYRDVFPAVISLMEKGYFPADKLVTKRIKLEEVIEQGFEGLLKEKN